MTPTTRPDATSRRPGFLSRFISNLKSWFKRMFGKEDNSDIYPFF